MDDLYTRFNSELKDKIRDFRKLLDELSESYFGSAFDLERIRKEYREFLDLKKYATDRNRSITVATERAPREAYQDIDSMEKFIGKQIDPFIKMFIFIIELYEESP